MYPLAVHDTKVHINKDHNITNTNKADESHKLLTVYPLIPLKSVVSCGKVWLQWQRLYWQHGMDWLTMAAVCQNMDPGG